MAYGNFKDLSRKTASDETLHNKAFKIAKNLKYDGYQEGLASIVYKFFDKNSSSLAHTSASGIVVTSKIMPNQSTRRRITKANYLKT